MKLLYVFLTLCVACYVFASEEVAIGLDKQVVPVLEAIDEDPIANNENTRCFREAIQDNDIDRAIRYFGISNYAEAEYCSLYLIKLGKPELITQLIRDSEHFNGLLLKQLLVHTEQPFIDTVLGGLKLSNELLESVASRDAIMCMPDKYIYVLKKFTDKTAQKNAVKYGLSNSLFPQRKFECLGPMLTALGSGTFLNPDLENIAIRATFNEASCYCNDEGAADWAKRLFDHPAVSAINYSNALYHSYPTFYSTKNRVRRAQTFYWLLARADRIDLENVVRDSKFSGVLSEFQEAVNYVRGTVGLVARHGTTHRLRVAYIQDAIGDHILEDLSKIISSYMGW